MRSPRDIYRGGVYFALDKRLTIMHVSHSGFRAAKHGNFTLTSVYERAVSGQRQIPDKNVYCEAEKDINSMQMKRNVEKQANKFIFVSLTLVV